MMNGDHKEHEIHGVESYIDDVLTVVVIGASGDLAKKKTYPALYTLFVKGFLPENTKIYGYARSKKTDKELHERITPFLKKEQPHAEEQDMKEFLEMCVYRRGQYGSAEDLGKVVEEASKFEAKAKGNSKKVNRLFYFAIPPSVYADVAAAIHEVGISKEGFTRMIIEKPFGHDLDSAKELSKKLEKHFTEEYIFRIDHYLGKEMVQNMLVLRFGNVFFEPLWNNKYIDCVYISFKEPFGTEGRGGYFDNNGIIRDVMQNHLLQALALFAMEPPVSIDDGGSVRNEKTKLLKSIQPIKLSEVVVGQYVGSKDGKKPGYKDDETLKNKDSITPTFCSAVLRICNQRWDGVPFIMRAGKALNQRKVLRMNCKRFLT
uniref:Glucose-6-phosphate 1-dehydrogenase n=1 Tax=Lotharella globosa TaxID=91324 RepID=A0A7S3ZDH1_9EUKA